MTRGGTLQRLSGEHKTLDYLSRPQRPKSHREEPQLGSFCFFARRDRTATPPSSCQWTRDLVGPVHECVKQNEGKQLGRGNNWTGGRAGGQAREFAGEGHNTITTAGLTRGLCSMATASFFWHNVKACHEIKYCQNKPVHRNANKNVSATHNKHISKQKENK